MKTRLPFYLTAWVIWMGATFFVTHHHQPFSLWIANWFQWDGHLFDRIWRLHYDIKASPTDLGAPPGFPILIGSLSAILRCSLVAAAMLINLPCLLGAAVLASELLAREFKVSPMALFLFFLASPVSYFGFAPYSDCVFTVMLWALLWLLRDSSTATTRWKQITELLLAFFLPWVRITGHALIFLSWFRPRLLFCFGLAGLAWLGLNIYISGNALYFSNVAPHFADMASGGFIQGFRYSWAAMWLPPGTGSDGFMSWLQFGFLPMIYFLLLVLVSAWLIWVKKPIYAVVVLPILLLSHHQAFWRSSVRYDFPIFIFLALPILTLAIRQTKEWRRRSVLAVFYALVICQFVLGLMFANLFHQGAWAF